jgi:hypothetical protein
MDEMVAADGKAVTVATNLPDGDLRVHHFGARSNGSRTTVDGLHGISVHIVWQT